MPLPEVADGKTEAEAVAEIVRLGSVDVVELLPDAITLARDGFGNIEQIDPEQYALHPRRPRTEHQFHTEQSFGQYVERHGTVGVTSVYCDVKALAVTAVIDEHDTVAAHDPATTAGWRDWRAVLQLEHDEGWLNWLAISGKWIKQSAFIDHLEDRIGDVVEPAETDLLDIARRFRAQKSIEYKSAVALANGEVQLTYAETVTQGGGPTTRDLQVPERIKLALKPIKGADLFNVNARLRWRIGDDAGLLIMVKLDRVDECLETAWHELTDRMQAHLAQFLVFEGAPS